MPDPSDDDHPWANVQAVLAAEERRKAEEKTTKQLRAKAEVDSEESEDETAAILNAEQELRSSEGDIDPLAVSEMLAAMEGAVPATRDEAWAAQVQLRVMQRRIDKTGGPLLA